LDPAANLIWLAHCEFPPNRWFIDGSYVQQRDIIWRQLAETSGSAARETWVGGRIGPGSRVQAILTDIARTSPLDLAMLTVACHQIRAAAQ
jgi:NAD-specific glutamate dehydrogenase